MTRYETRVCDVCQRRSEPLAPQDHELAGWTMLGPHDLCPVCSFAIARDPGEATPP